MGIVIRLQFGVGGVAVVREVVDEVLRGIRHAAHRLQTALGLQHEFAAHVTAFDIAEPAGAVGDHQIEFVFLLFEILPDLVAEESGVVGDHAPRCVVPEDEDVGQLGGNADLVVGGERVKLHILLLEHDGAVGFEKVQLQPEAPVVAVELAVGLLPEELLDLVDDPGVAVEVQNVALRHRGEARHAVRKQIGHAVILVAVSDEDMLQPFGVELIFVLLREGVGAEVDADGVAQLVCRPQPDVPAAVFPRLAADAAVAENRGDAFRRRTSEDLYFSHDALLP